MRDRDLHPSEPGESSQHMDGGETGNDEKEFKRSRVMSHQPSTRTIETEIAIEATPERVWKALTDAVELTRWFPLEAGVEPGEGGKILLSWGANMEGLSRIRVWEPHRHLQTSWMEPTERMKASGKDAPAGSTANLAAGGEWPGDKLIVDYFLEAEGGKTVLRLVHSGFSADARWDNEFDSHRRGWNYELRSLRHYLERHAGRQRKMVWLRAPLQVSAEVAWNRLIGPEGLAREGSLGRSQVDHAYRVRTVHGDDLKGTVTIFDQPLQLGLTLDNMRSSLLRFSIETCYGPAEANLFLSSWTGDDGDPAMQSFRERWAVTLTELAS